jgi:diaminopimelate epimerase
MQDKIPFVKTQGTGNDFIIIERKDIPGIDINAYSLYLNDRHFGIGGDGLLIVDKANDLYKMTMINPDGSEAMCGNGIRCFGLYLKEKGYIKENKFTVDSIAGTKELEYENKDGKHYFTVNMGKPILERDKIPVAGKGASPVIDMPVMIKGNEYELTCVSMGNPHAVIFVDSYENLNLHETGHNIEHHALFPERTNVEFIKIIDRNNILMRVWERGAGETLACGTGTCAAVVAANLKNYVDNEVNVTLPGGEVNIKYSGDDVVMTGEANIVFSGNIDIDKVKNSFPDSFSKKVMLLK